ncbi:MAG: hypothetical protein R2709_00115 [Marmoricola sp.]
MTLPGAREVRAPRGTCRITARSWQTEAPLRMLLMNNLDPEVAERPDDRGVRHGRAARSWAAYDAIIKTLTELAPDETCWCSQENRPESSARTSGRLGS